MRFLFGLFLFLTGDLYAQAASKYLVLKNGDSIFYKNDLVVDNNLIYKWKFIAVDSVTYKIHEVKAAYFENNFYYNCNGRSLYKQVIQGKINVYAKQDKDTISDADGFVKYPLFVQQATEKPRPMNAKNLAMMISDPELSYPYQVKNANRNSGNALMITGISAGAAVTAVSAFVALFSAMFGDNETANTALIVSGAGLLVGSALTISGATLKSGSKKLSLQPIYQYNSK